MQPHTPLINEQSTNPNHQRGKFASPTNSSASPLTHQASPMSVLQTSHHTTASPEDCRTYVLSIVTPALRFCFDVAYTTQLFFTLVLSFLLAHGLYATKALAISSYCASRIFLVNAWYTLVFVAINSFHASRIVGIKTSHLLGTIAAFTRRNGSTLSEYGWMTASVALKRGWKRLEKVRAKIFFEFVVWIMHPSPLVLFIFWPGWVFVFIGVGYCYYCC